MDNIKVINNRKQQQFETDADEDLSVLVYRLQGNNIALMHTEVPEKLSGQGIGSALVKYGLEWSKEHYKKVIVQCPFVASYLKKHPEFNFLILQNP